MALDSNFSSELKKAIIEKIVQIMMDKSDSTLALDVKTAAALIGVNHLKIYALCRCKSNRFPCLKMGSRLKIPIIQLLDWIEAESWKSKFD